MDDDDDWVEVEAEADIVGPAACRTLDTQEAAHPMYGDLLDALAACGIEWAYSLQCRNCGRLHGARLPLSATAVAAIAERLFIGDRCTACDVVVPRGSWSVVRTIGLKAPWARKDKHRHCQSPYCLGGQHDRVDDDDKENCRACGKVICTAPTCVGPSPIPVQGYGEDPQVACMHCHRAYIHQDSVEVTVYGRDAALHQAVIQKQCRVSRKEFFWGSAGGGLGQQFRVHIAEPDDARFRVAEGTRGLWVGILVVVHQGGVGDTVVRWEAGEGRGAAELRTWWDEFWRDAKQKTVEVDVPGGTGVHGPLSIPTADAEAAVHDDARSPVPDDSPAAPVPRVVPRLAPPLPARTPVGSPPVESIASSGSVDPREYADLIDSALLLTPRPVDAPPAAVAAGTDSVPSPPPQPASPRPSPSRTPIVDDFFGRVAEADAAIKDDLLRRTSQQSAVPPPTTVATVVAAATAGKGNTPVPCIACDAESPTPSDPPPPPWALCEACALYFNAAFPAVVALEVLYAPGDADAIPGIAGHDEVVGTSVTALLLERLLKTHLACEGVPHAVWSRGVRVLACPQCYAAVHPGEDGSSTTADGGLTCPACGLTDRRDAASASSFKPLRRYLCVRFAANGVPAKRALHAEGELDRQQLQGILDNVDDVIAEWKARRHCAATGHAPYCSGECGGGVCSAQYRGGCTSGSWARMLLQ